MKKRILSLFIILSLIVLGTSACFMNNESTLPSSSSPQSSIPDTGKNDPPPTVSPAAPTPESTPVSSPTQSTPPEKPTASAEPTAPPEPEIPAEPAAPVEPEIPAEPAVPPEPEIPAEPAAPVEPENPGQPEESGGDPVYTVTPDTEVIPGTVPEESADSTPTEPDAPNGTGEPPHMHHEKIPILMYHEVNDLLANELYLSVEDFISHLDYFEQEGITPISMQQLYDHWVNDAPIPEKPIVLTFDDGYRSMYTTVYPLLKERGWSGTFYCITDARWSRNFISPDMMAEMAANGMELGSHSTSHVELSALSGDELADMLVNSKYVLSSITGKDISTIAYPFGKYNSETESAASDAGYVCGVTTRPGFAEKSQGLFALNRFAVCKDFDAAWLKEILSPLGY